MYVEGSLKKMMKIEEKWRPGTKGGWNALKLL
jgi:hypothetical protein